jgi:hypothetical protein
LGRPFAAVIKLNAEGKLEFDFGEDQKKEQDGPPPDFSGQEPLGTCPKCGAQVFEGSMSYVCEKGDFKTGKIILQKAIEREQVKKLLTGGKTDLIDGFISKKGRPFKAFLVLNEKGVGFEFEPRQARGKAKVAREPKPKIELAALPVVAKCGLCGGKVHETEKEFICERAQADSRPCKTRFDKIKCERLIETVQAKKLIEDGRTDLLTGFKSRTGKPFSAALVRDSKGKITYEFGSDDTFNGGS